MAKRPAKDPDTPEIGDSVILSGEVVYIDDDFVPRVAIAGVEYPVRVTGHRYDLIKSTKPKASKWDKPG